MIAGGPFPVKLTSSGVLFCNLVGNGPKRFRLSLEASDDVSVFKIIDIDTVPWSKNYVWYMHMQNSAYTTLHYFIWKYKPCRVDVEDVGEAVDDAMIKLFCALLQINKLLLVLRLFVPLNELLRFKLLLTRTLFKLLIVLWWLPWLFNRISCSLVSPLKRNLNKYMFDGQYICT